jgi:hypothetical protein
MYTKENPGPKFLAYWKKAVATKKAAEATGNAPKSTSSKSRKAIEALYTNCPSPALRFLLLNIMGDPTVTDEMVREGLIPFQQEMERIIQTQFPDTWAKLAQLNAKRKKIESELGLSEETPADDAKPDADASDADSDESSED